jgi:general secretion pathway protein M
MNLQEYWSGLQPREQKMLGGGGVALVLILLYALIIDPISTELTRLRVSVTAQQEELAWMRQAAIEVKSLMRSSPRTTGRSGQSAMSAIDATARKFGLGKSLKQLSPNGGKVRVRLEAASFDAMLKWLGELSEKQGIGVDSLNMERLADPGLVNATVVLGGEQ